MRPQTIPQPALRRFEAADARRPAGDENFAINPADDPLAWRPDTWDVVPENVDVRVPERREPFPRDEIDPFDTLPPKAPVWDAAKAFEMDASPVAPWAEDLPMGENHAPAFGDPLQHETPVLVPAGAPWWADLEQPWDGIELD